jgi:F-type H+-transporting ATPase subunit epsilon
VKLRIAVPSRMVVDEEVASVCAPGRTGEFGLRPGHEPFYTCLAIGILSYRPASGGERFVAVRRGMLAVRDDVVDVTTRDAVLGEQLDGLERRVLADFAERDAAEYASDTSFRKMHLAAMRQLAGYEQSQHPA